MPVSECDSGKPLTVAPPIGGATVRDSPCASGPQKCMKPHCGAGGFACQLLAGAGLAGETTCPTIVASSMESPWPFRPPKVMKVNRSLTVAAPIARPVTSPIGAATRSEEHTSELQSLRHLVCRLL